MEAFCKRDFFDDKFKLIIFEFGKSYYYEINDYYDILVYHVFYTSIYDNGMKKSYHTLNHRLFENYFCNNTELRKLKLKKLNKI